ncbi:fructokinase [Sphingomonas sp. PP-CE-3A-406]|uniref:ROK family protein n=1 Tax=unclassified Sphingomonas TaxID=196159 RepID=UPI000EF8860F|nr:MULTISPECIES: ROK family protein [unclassified Sphingomonas]RMB28550.1 fructokinase [Sphingomonas sp. PP-F2F-G114-C0414]RMB55875.1 fructokinase [Sphingomonas sp. PP-CE-3A-406]TCP66729.1 fructokinase [Sphingomonas sp. PP-CE-1G-424]
MTEAPLVAGIELGGTKCICILARGPDQIEETVRIPTTRPEETLAAIEAVLDRWSGFVAIGIASFGPVSIDRHAGDYGHITSTPKPGWAGTDIAGRLHRRYGVPTGFHTDVVGAALAEARWGAATGLPDIAYVTVGTGVGVGMIANHRPIDGLTHSELGHIRPVRFRGDDWVGNCPFHGACLEGLVSGPAIAARIGKPADQAPAEDPVWDGVADALGQLCHTLVLTGIPRRIVMGGGVMGATHLFPRVRAAMTRSLGGYITLPEVALTDTFIVPPALGNNAGPLGAIVLGAQALGQQLASSFTPS